MGDGLPLVVSKFRGLGLSQKMLHKVEDIARQRGGCKTTLEVLEGNAAAQASYGKFGFRRACLIRRSARCCSGPRRFNSLEGAEPVAAGLLAKAAAQSTLMSPDTPLSRASPFPHGCNYC